MCVKGGMQLCSCGGAPREGGKGVERGGDAVANCAEEISTYS